MDLIDNLERKSRFIALGQLYVDIFIGGNHLVLQIPSGAPTEFCDHDVAVAEEVDVEVGVGTWLRVGWVSIAVTGTEVLGTYFAGNVQLRNMVRQHSDDFRHRGYFQRGPYHENEIHEVSIMTHQPVVEGCREVLAKESDIRLHDPRDRDIVIFIIRTVFVALSFLPRPRRAVRASFPFETRFGLSDGSNASIAMGDLAGFQVLVYLFAFDFVFALDASRSGEGSMTLD